MIIEPLKKAPIIPRVALVNDDGIYVDETGCPFSHNSEYKYRLGEIVCFIFWDTAISLTRRGIGEILRWNTKEIRWRKSKHPEEDDWKARPFDCGVISYRSGATIASIGLNFDQALKELVEFRDWLADEGGRIHCTFGSTSMNLLRAKIDTRLISGLGATPPIDYTRGGRTLMGKEGRGTFEGKIANWDLPAAYAATLGHIRYGSPWMVRPFHRAVKAHEFGAPVYCHASVDIPNLSFGPLPGNIRRPGNPFDQQILNRFGYVTGQKIEGIWTFSELDAAAEVGCKITPLTCWANMSARQPFLPWWEAILRGRDLRGAIARSLAKRTGNALWGMMARDPKAKGKKVIYSYDNGKKKIRRIDVRSSGQRPGHDLAEAVSSEVRAKLYQHVVAADDHLLSAHTDGVWVQGNYDKPTGWRIKQEARRIDLFDPQTLRYYTGENRSVVVMSGVPPKLAPDYFERRWEQYEHAIADPNYLSNLRKNGRSARRVFRVSPPDNYDRSL